MQVIDLKEALKERSISFSSRAPKAQLVELLLRKLRNPDDERQQQQKPTLSRLQESTKKGAQHQQEAPGANQGVNKGVNSVVPGTQGLPQVATAAEAAAEKVKAGENKAVEHVALGDADVAGNLL